jgi:NAD(P)-dependent dehydrogenase (short-subunit alcohol dehydrogenase family)
MTTRVIVTGAATGIGAATVEALRRRGANVVGFDLVADPSRDIVSCDVRDQRSVDAAVDSAIDRLRGLDVLVNNAGVGYPQRATLPPGEDAAAVIDINLLGPWRVTAAALPALRAARGRVINVASGLAFLSLPLAPAYCMSKRGLVAYSDALRHEVAGEVTVTTIYPGYVRTAIHAPAERRGVGLEGLVAAEPVEKVASCIVRAAVGRPARDRATTWRGGLAYLGVRLAPRRWTDVVVGRRVRERADAIRRFE